MDDFPLGAIARALTRARWVVLVVVLLTGFLGYLLAGLRQPAYEAQATLLVSDSKMRDVASAVNPAGFIALLANRALAQQIIDEFDLDAAPYRLTPAGFLQMVRVEDVRNATLIRVRIQSPEAELAAKVTNRFAELAVELNRSLNQKDTAVARDLIKAQLDEAQTRLETARSAMLALRRESQVELSKADVAALVEQRQGIDELLVSLATEKARLAQLEHDVAAQAPTLDSPRSPTADADLVAAINEGTREPIASGRSDSRQQVATTDAARQEEARREDAERRREEATRGRDEVPVLPGGDSRANPVRLLLEYQVAAARAKVAALEQQRRELAAVSRLAPGRSVDLERLYRSEEELKRRELDVKVAEAAYADLAARYEQARLQVAGRSAELQIVDPAMVPTSPVSWGRLLIALLAAGLGLVAATGLVATRALIQTWRPT